MKNQPFGVDYVPKRHQAKIVDGKAYVGTISDIPPGKARAVVLEKFRIAVFNVDGTFYAVKDACPHAEYPLSKGVTTGGEVTCSSHNWKFDLKTGKCLKGGELSIRTFEVVLDGDEIWVKVA